jgi:hypothetical protein
MLCHRRARHKNPVAECATAWVPIFCRPFIGRRNEKARSGVRNLGKKQKLGRNRVIWSSGAVVMRKGAVSMRVCMRVPASLYARSRLVVFTNCP